MRVKRPTLRPFFLGSTAPLCWDSPPRAIVGMSAWCLRSQGSEPVGLARPDACRTYRRPYWKHSRKTANRLLGQRWVPHTAAPRSLVAITGAISACRSGDGSETKSKKARTYQTTEKPLPIKLWSPRLTWTSFSFSVTRLTISRRAALSGLGFVLYAFSRMVLSWALNIGGTRGVSQKLHQKLI